MRDPVLSALISEGEEILKEAAAANASQSDTETVSIEHVVDWHRRAAAFVAGRHPSLAGQLSTFKPFEPFNKIYATISSTLALLRATPGATQPAQPSNTIMPPSMTTAGQQKPGGISLGAKSFQELFLELIPKTPWVRFIVLPLIGSIALIVLLWSALPDTVKTEILKPMMPQFFPPAKSGAVETETGAKKQPASVPTQ
jgi:hypothetical protein